jgi:hypothetical protein
MLHCCDNRMHAMPFNLKNTKVVALFSTTIIPPPDRSTHTSNVAQGLRVPIFGRRDRIMLLT